MLPFFQLQPEKNEKGSENLSESGSLERDIEQKKVILIQKGADVNKRNSSGTLKNWKILMKEFNFSVKAK